MKYSNHYIGNIKLNEQIKLETCFAEEQKYIWKKKDCPVTEDPACKYVPN